MNFDFLCMCVCLCIFVLNITVKALHSHAQQVHSNQKANDVGESTDATEKGKIFVENSNPK